MNVSEIRAPKMVAFCSEDTRSGLTTIQCPSARPFEASFSTQNRARKIGICRSSGRHDESGLALFSR